MAQAMLEFQNFRLKKSKTKTTSCQTGDPFEMFGHMSKTKTFHLYYSIRFKDYVLCLTFSNNKKYIIRRVEWKKLISYFFFIHNVLGK